MVCLPVVVKSLVLVVVRSRVLSWFGNLVLVVVKTYSPHRTTPQEQPLVAKHIEGTNRVRNDRSRTRRTHEVPFIVACSHFTRKNTRFRAPASSPKHRPCNMHAAITMRSATTASGNAWNYSTGTTTCCKTHRRNQSRPERPQPHPSHTRGTFHRRLQPLYTEKHKVSCSGFLPKT